MSKRWVATGAAARILGVSPVTIQRWVDAGILNAERTAGGHRRIPVAELRKVLKSVAQANSSSCNPEDWYKIFSTTDPMFTKRKLITARNRCGSWAELADEIAASLTDLGTRWETGACLVFEEHLASETLRRALTSHVLDLLSPRRDLPTALLLTVEGERHTLGLALAEPVLIEAGWLPLLIGEGPPAAELEAMILTLRPNLLILTGTAGLKKKFVTCYQAAVIEACNRHNSPAIICSGGATWQNLSEITTVSSFIQLEKYLYSHPR